MSPIQILEPLIFIALTIIAIGFVFKRGKIISKTIRLGRDEELKGPKSARWKNVFLLALGQQKMFRKPGVAILHLIVYAGFIIINIEIIEIILDGILGQHRLFAPLLGAVYPVLINSFEALALLVLLACIVFLIRRNLKSITRLQSADLNGWPRKDATIILGAEIILMSLFLIMNACDTLLQERGQLSYSEHPTGNFWISSLLHPLLSNWSTHSLVIAERASWWLHILGIYAFLNYLPYSKHLHIILAFPNAYYARLEPSGKMENMPAIQQEVIYAMQPELAPTDSNTSPPRFGARDVMDLSWKNLLDAYSCTECGRCSSACPANQTGKMLSPRKIMMDTRDRLEEVGQSIAKHGTWHDDSRALLHDYISVEEINACTTCNACVQECPVSINPLDIILQLRRNLVMEESNTPAEWATLFGNVENNFAPWKFNPEEREKWIESTK
ncbi:MAG: (Fe-S)-binding protein [Terrimonas sp.]|jgi:heterodisulfide reductase subunit C|nr:(Fe-S)-binding protein [Terrimonas sp.]